MSYSWLYTLFVGEDACFKQKARQRKHDDIDPQLSPGLGLFVEPVKYSTFLSSVKDQNEVRHSYIGTSPFLLDCRSAAALASVALNKPTVNDTRAAVARALVLVVAHGTNYISVWAIYQRARRRWLIEGLRYLLILACLTDTRQWISSS